MKPVALAWRVVRADRLATALTALGVAVASGLVLSLVGVPFATQARAERGAWQVPHSGAGAAVVSVATGTDRFEGRVVTRVDVAPLVDPVRIALPPGVGRLPGAGEALVSPALAHLAATRPPAQLADRFDAEVVGLLGEGALRFPEQLVLLVGHAPGAGPATAVPVSGLGERPPAPDPVLSLLAGVGVVVLLVPSLVLVASASRLTAARRERRLAALRLAGATPAQVLAVVAAETGVAAVAGAVVGVAVVPVARVAAARVPWGGGTWHPGDFALPWYLTGAVAVGVALLVVGAAVAGLRRVVTAPLLVAAATERRRPSAARLVLVPVAALLFFWALTTTSLSGALLPLLATLGLLMWSPTVVGPWVTASLGRVFTKVWRRPALLLAGRRLRDDPRAAYRASAGVVLAVFAGSLALTVLPGIEARAVATGPYDAGVPRVTVPVDRAPAVARAVDRALAGYGSRAVLVGRSAEPFALVARCADALEVLAAHPSCRSGPVVWTPGGRALAAEPVPPDGLALVDATTRDRVAEVSTVDVVVPPGVPAEVARTVLRTASDGAEVVSGEMLLSDQRAQLSDLRRVTVIGLVAAVLLAGLSAAITTAGSVLDRRRTFGALTAAGTPVRTLARALRAEAALPALAATTGAGVLGTVVGVGLFGLVSGSPPVLTPWLAAPAALGVLVALLAASVCGPALRRVSTEPLAAE